MALAPNASLYLDAANATADKYGVPREIFSAIIEKESAWNPYAVGAKNNDGTFDYGIMQLNSKYYPNAPSMSLGEQMETGAQALATNYKATGDWYQAVRAYNGGLTGTKNNPNLSVGYADKVIGFAKSLGFSGVTPSGATEAAGGDPKSTFEELWDVVKRGVLGTVLGPVLGNPASQQAGETAIEEGKEVLANTSPSAVGDRIKSWVSDNALIATVAVLGGGIIIFSLWDTIGAGPIKVGK